MEIDNKSAHYKFPLGALSSITNRVTGVALSVGELRVLQEPTLLGRGWLHHRSDAGKPLLS